MVVGQPPPLPRDKAIMNTKRVLVLLFLALLGPSGSAAMAGQDCPRWRPCGPGISNGGNRLLPQGSHGADFRKACADHDACYRNQCTDRRSSDVRFYNQMKAARQCSSNPRACAKQARRYYVAVRLLGWTQ
ncbi:MAG TPA: hypothetical protein DCF63_13720 [Planctomycetaceae bacterium]|nr:hypothetical protein [Planctomycetaceae bacterium]